MAFYDSGPAVRYDSGLRYSIPGVVPAINRTKAMKKVKLEFSSKDNNMLSVFAKAHGAAADNPLNGFTGLTPTKTEYDAGVAELDAAILGRESAENGLTTAMDREAAARAAMETLLRGRASYVDGKAKGDPDIIHKAAFASDADKNPIGALPSPQNLRAAHNGHSGQIYLRCKPVKGAKSYVTECREHGATLGEWQQVKIGTTASLTATGLTPGKEYAFRMKVVGTAGDGPWSDEVVKMAV
jgi:Fibronectin type III domain